MQKRITVSATIASILIGILFGVAGSQGSVTYDNLPLFAICASIGFILHWLIFIPSFIFQTEHYFDLTGSISYIAAVCLGIFLNSSADIRDLIIALLIVIWAIRLGTLLFSRVKKHGKDGRFTVMKTQFHWYLMTWTIGGLWVFMTMAAGLAAITSNESHPLGIFTYLGIALWLLGFSIEVIADNQKTKFNADPSNKGRFITNGLWAWSRHPNYFGEITLWLGITIIALPVLSSWQFMMLLSPVFVFILLTKISGIPLLEGRGEKKWGSDPDYQDYLQRTPRLMLKRPKL